MAMTDAGSSHRSKPENSYTFMWILGFGQIELLGVLVEDHFFFFVSIAEIYLLIVFGFGNYF